MQIEEIAPRTVVTGRFLILEAQLRTAKNGSQFVALRLGDKSGEIGAKLWDANEEIFGRVPAGQVLEVKNLAAREFAGAVQLELDAKAASSWRVLPEAEVDFADFLPSAPRPRGTLAPPGDGHGRRRRTSSGGLAAGRFSPTTSCAPRLPRCPRRSSVIMSTSAACWSIRPAWCAL